MAFQYVTFVASGGTPVRICNVRGAPYPTTGQGAIVFNEGPVFHNPVFTDPIYAGDLTIEGDLVVEGTFFGTVSASSVFPVRTVTNGAATLQIQSNDYEVCIANSPATSVLVTLPENPTNGQLARVSDAVGSLSYGTIEFTVVGAAGEQINGTSSLIMSSPYQSIQFRFNGTTGRWNTQL